LEQLATFLPLILIFAVFWLLIIRPQRRRQREMADTQSSLVPGSEVMLGSGIFGTVSAVSDETLQLEVSPGTQLKVARQAVVRVIEPEPLQQPGTDAAHRTEPDQQQP
jgi:preprotein translocase subunit YajC